MTTESKHVEVILAGTGFRSTGDSHREVGEVFGREVVSLRLIDPRFYHLDTAISVLDPVEGPGGVEKANIAYLPSAFNEPSLASITRAVTPRTRTPPGIITELAETGPAPMT